MSEISHHTTSVRERIRYPINEEVIEFIKQNGWATTPEVAKHFNVYFRHTRTKPRFAPADKIEGQVRRLYNKGKLIRREIPPNRKREDERTVFEYYIPDEGKSKCTYYVTYDLIWRVKPEIKLKISRLVFAHEIEELKHSLNVKNLTIEELL